MTSSGTHGEFPYWETVFSPCTLTFEAVDGIPWCCRSNKTFTVVSQSHTVRFIILYKQVQSLECVDEIL